MSAAPQPAAPRQAPPSVPLPAQAVGAAPGLIPGAPRNLMAQEYLRRLTPEEIEELKFQEELKQLQAQIDETMPMMSQLAGFYFGGYLVDIAMRIWQPAWLFTGRIH
eukprot:c1390_g1_i1.p2 GENE.c1390_g1_i1~~c1390_g1_i1.p2  ORF type:complete len:107 (+),score=12.01 c1390_g1_i1:54-374(+)